MRAQADWSGQRRPEREFGKLRRIFGHRRNFPSVCLRATFVRCVRSAQTFAAFEFLAPRRFIPRFRPEKATQICATWRHLPTVDRPLRRDLFSVTLRMDHCKRRPQPTLTVATGWVVLS